MAQISAEFVERYQLEHQKNPRSRVFAPLAEAYRKMGLLEEALRVCEKGLLHHPSFAGGLVAHAKILIDLKRFEEALKQAETAAKVSPDNLLAHSLLGEALLQLRRPKEALNAFKTALLLNPNDQRAKTIVQKWEFLSADEYDDELFEIKPQIEPKSEAPLTERETLNRIDRAVSLADAFTVRGDHESALRILTEASKKLGDSAEIEKRLKLLARRAQNKPNPAKQLNEDQTIDLKRQKLESFLRRINERRFGG